MAVVIGLTEQVRAGHVRPVPETSPVLYSLLRTASRVGILLQVFFGGSVDVGNGGCRE